MRTLCGSFEDVTPSWHDRHLGPIFTTIFVHEQFDSYRTVYDTIVPRQGWHLWSLNFLASHCPRNRSLLDISPFHQRSLPLRDLSIFLFFRRVVRGNINRRTCSENPGVSILFSFFCLALFVLHHRADLDEHSRFAKTLDSSDQRI